MISNKKLVVGLGSVLGVTFILAIPNAWQNLGGIAARQAAANFRLIEWKEAYQALLPVNKRWESSFVNFNSVPDQLTLTRIAHVEQYMLSLDVDKVKQVGSHEVLVNDRPVGLQKLCIATDGDALELSADSIYAVRNGVRELAQRSDIEMGSIEIAVERPTGSKEKTQYKAKVTPFCIRIRTDKN